MAGQEVHHPVFARFYARFSESGERRGAAEHRARLLAGLAGRTIELGAGNGLNFAHYPDKVTEVVAVEPEPHLRAEAEKAAARASVPITVVSGVADEVPAEDGSFDAAIASLVLCTVPDQRRALAELYRVLRPGGELRFYEHVVAKGGAGARFQRFADATFWPRIAGGCHMSRDTASAIEAGGFEIEACERFGFTPMAVGPGIPHILGRARKL